MSYQYRIKEVTVPLKTGNTTFFYPQIKLEKVIKTGYLWWKKITKEEYWDNLYIQTNGRIYAFDSIDGVVASFDNKEKALELIEKHKIQFKEEVKELYRINANNWNDDRFVKFHEVI